MYKCRECGRAYPSMEEQCIRCGGKILEEAKAEAYIMKNGVKKAPTKSYASGQESTYGQESTSHQERGYNQDYTNTNQGNESYDEDYDDEDESFEAYESYGVYDRA